MTHFFTADEHYGHENIIKYCNRPFKTVGEMDAEIIQRHNEVVGPNDTVIHAGDFTLKSKEEATEYLNRLTGRHIFIQGSHDRWRDDLSYLIERKIEGQHITICHYAMLKWPRSHYGSWQLYGHSHGKLSSLENQWDIGVDNNDFYPYSFEDLKNKINNFELTLEKLKELDPGIFAKGVCVDDCGDKWNSVCLAWTGKATRWVAVKGDIPDWAIYAQNPHYVDSDDLEVKMLGMSGIWDWDKIRDQGDKIGSEKSIRRLVPCDDEAFKMYRY